MEHEQEKKMIESLFLLASRAKRSHVGSQVKQARDVVPRYGGVHDRTRLEPTVFEVYICTKLYGLGKFCCFPVSSVPV